MGGELGRGEFAVTYLCTEAATGARMICKSRGHYNERAAAAVTRTIVEVVQVRCKDSKLCSAADARVVVTDRARTKSNRTNLVLSSPAFAAMAWLRDWPSSAPSMSSTRGLGRCRLKIVGVCVCTVPHEYKRKNLAVRVEDQSRAPASWLSRSSTRVAKSSRRSSRRSGSS